MGQFTLVEWLLVGSTALTAGSQIKAAKEQKVEYELARRKEESASLDREVQRRRRVKALIGAQAAEAAAKGLEMSGSVSNISITDAKRAGEDTLIDSVNTRATIASLNRASNTATRVGYTRAATTIMSGAERFYARREGT